MKVRGAEVGTCVLRPLGAGEGHLPGAAKAEDGEDGSAPGPSLKGPSGCPPPALPVSAGGREERPMGDKKGKSRWTGLKEEPGLTTTSTCE